MPRHHNPYPEEFKKKLLALVREGRRRGELARQFEPMAQAIRNWWPRPIETKAADRMV